MTDEELDDYFANNSSDYHIHDLNDKYREFLKNRSVEDVYLDMIFAKEYPKKVAKILETMERDANTK